MSGRNTIAAPRPIRAGEEFSLTHYLESEEPSSKKPRFDYRNPSTLAPETAEEDTILELDEIGRGGQQTKRNAVNLDGFESDSSNENFNTRANAKASSARKRGRQHHISKDEEENDMFVDLDESHRDGDDDEDVVREGKTKKKDVRFLEEDEIVGQVQSSKAGGHVSADFTLNGNPRARDADVESSSDESAGDEERATVGDDVDEELGAGSKKKHAPKLDAFNMRVENEEGRFDETGNYVRRAADPDAVHDSWLEGVSKKDTKRAREAHEKREEDRRKRDLEDDSLLTSDMLATLITHLERGETILEALARLGKAKGKKKPRRQRKARTNGAEMDIDTDESEDVKRREAVEAVTGAADQLLTRGQTDIYDAERELLMRQYHRETGEDWVEPQTKDPANGSRVEVQHFQYRWSDARDGGEIHGPYDGPTMSAWSEAGYFGDGVEFKRIDDTEWTRSIDFA